MAIRKGSQSIIIENPNLGGISDSIYLGLPNALASIVGFDLHSIPGVMLVNQQFTVEGGGAPTDDLYKILPCSDGNIYLFGQTLGHVYKNASGTYTLLGTTTPSSGNNGVLDAVEYNGYIYYAMQNRVGQWDFTQAFSTRSDSWQNFAIGNATYHPMFFLPNTGFLYLGDGTNIASIDTSNAFLPAAFAGIAKPYICTCLGGQGSDLLIGTIATTNVGKSFVIRWNTVSSYATWNYPITEAGINAFFPSDDEVLLNAGLAGNLYHLNGSIFEIIKQVPPIFPNTYSPSNQGKVYYPAVANKQGIPLFGFSNVGGNIALQGIYSYGHRNPSYPKILTLEVPISTNDFSNITIWSIAAAGSDIYTSWKDTTSGTVYGIDKLDWSNKYSGAYFETLIIRYTKVFLENFDKFVVNFAQSLPANTQINISYSINGAAYVAWTQGTDILNDILRNETVADRRIDAKNLQIKVSVTAYQNTAPIIEDFIILFQ